MEALRVVSPRAEWSFHSLPARLSFIGRKRIHEIHESHENQEVKIDDSRLWTE
jgi:hypothetical protein